MSEKTDQVLITTLAVCAQEYVLGDGDEAALDEANDALLERLLARSDQKPGKPDGGDWRKAEGAAPRRPGDDLSPEDAIRLIRDGKPPSEPVLFVLKYMGEYLHPESMSFVSAEEAWAHVKDPGSGLYTPWKEGESLADWKVIQLAAEEDK